LGPPNSGRSTPGRDAIKTNSSTHLDKKKKSPKEAGKKKENLLRKEGDWRDALQVEWNTKGINAVGPRGDLNSPGDRQGIPAKNQNPSQAVAAPLGKPRLFGGGGKNRFSAQRPAQEGGNLLQGSKKAIVQAEGLTDIGGGRASYSIRTERELIGDAAFFYK